jgi:glucose dehydrogenase
LFGKQYNRRVLFLLLISLATLPLFGQGTTTPAGDWPMFNRDLAGTRYSPLTQITPGNVGKLTQAWSYRLQPGTFRFATAGGMSELTPVVVNGVMYVSAQTRVMALEPETGKEIWRYEVPGGQASPRGVAYWPGDGQNPPRILFTAGPNLIALNTRTGQADPGFGKEGTVDMKVPYNGVPTIFNNVVLVGASTGERETGPPGNTRAYDARTGAKLWEFQTVPRPGEIGHDTWLNDGWRDRSGTNTWAWYMTADEERGIVYMTFGAPTANYYGGDRPGANLFGNSVVAVDAATGKYKWHFQVVHHDLWDFDLPPAPGLVDIVKDGMEIPALAQIGKSAYMFILDRVTGKPVFGVEERAVPKGDVPGEWYSPTQPFPVKPPALARVGFTKEEMVTAEDTTPEHAMACQELWDKSGGFYNAGPFTPFLFHESGSPPEEHARTTELGSVEASRVPDVRGGRAGPVRAPKSTIQFPGGTGGASWGGVAVDPKTGYVFVQTHDNALTGWVEKKQDGRRYENANLPYDRGNINGGGAAQFSAPIKDQNGRTIANLPCQKPPWSRLTQKTALRREGQFGTNLGTSGTGRGRTGLAAPVP